MAKTKLRSMRMTPFNPNQYYKAVGDDHHPVKLNYTNINTAKPGRYALTLSAKTNKITTKRTVLIIIEEEKAFKAAG